MVQFGLVLAAAQSEESTRKYRQIFGEILTPAERPHGNRDITTGREDLLELVDKFRSVFRCTERFNLLFLKLQMPTL